MQEGGRDAGARADVCDAGAGEGVTCEFLDGVEEGGWVGGAVLGVLGRGGVEGVGSGGGRGGEECDEVVMGPWSLGWVWGAGDFGDRWGGERRGRGEERGRGWAGPGREAWGCQGRVPVGWWPWFGGATVVVQPG